MSKKKGVYRYLAGRCPGCKRKLVLKRLPLEREPTFHPSEMVQAECSRCGPVTLLAADLFRYETATPLEDRPGGKLQEPGDR